MLSVLVLSLLLTAGRVFGYSLESDWDADFSESAPLDNDIEDHAADAGDVDTDVGFAGQEEWQDPRLLILPVGAGNLLNINTTAALLALLGAAALLSALGFLIYAIVASKLKSAYGGSSYGGGSYYSSGGYGGGGYGGSYGGGGGYGGGSSGGGYGYARYPASTSPKKKQSVKKTKNNRQQTKVFGHPPSLFRSVASANRSDRSDPRFVFFIATFFIIRFLIRFSSRGFHVLASRRKNKLLLGICPNFRIFLPIFWSFFDSLVSKRYPRSALPFWVRLNGIFFLIPADLS